MLLIRAEDLESVGIACGTATQLTFQNTSFTKGRSFAKSERQAAITTCNQYLKADILCLIVENPTHFTLWPEKKDVNLSSRDSALSPSKASKYQNTLTSPTSQAKNSRYHQTNLINPENNYHPSASRFAQNKH
ncbi:hypothetical protein NG798_14335 [Ancylothrix sp. C2]|uniref:hypothetical protein n=1 Tax=Ancylothrix sp. D3o TaxID=2953691 RepID=UPI0021BB6324|nr:hypothetical protein [Ancylothrix sp. D3o]MCT7950974.1 hypothetical protein [Ancylothrix sp. D3o]